MSDLDQIEDLLTEEPDTGPGDTLDQIDDLLSGKEPKAPEGEQAAEPTGDSETEEEGTEEAQEEIPDGVDYDLVVPISNGEPVTLGQLKDAYQDQQRITLEVQERENAIMAQMNELQEMSQHVQLPPERLAAIKQRQEQYLMQEHGRMLEAIPEFKDQAAFSEAKKAIDALAADYGISEEVGKIANHKIVKLLNDFAKLRQGIRAAKDNVKPLRGKDPKARNKAAGKPNPAALAAQKAKQTGSKSDQLAAIDALLQ